MSKEKDKERVQKLFTEIANDFTKKLPHLGPTDVTIHDVLWYLVEKGLLVGGSLPSVSDEELDWRKMPEHIKRALSEYSDNEKDQITFFDGIKWYHDFVRTRLSVETKD